MYRQKENDQRRFPTARRQSPCTHARMDSVLESAFHGFAEINNGVEALEAATHICLLLLGARPAWRFDLGYGEEQRRMLTYIQERWGDELGILRGRGWNSEPLVYSRAEVARQHLEPCLRAYRDTVLSRYGDQNQAAWDVQRPLLGFTAQATAIHGADEGSLLKLRVHFTAAFGGGSLCLIGFYCPHAQRQAASDALRRGIVAAAQPIIGQIICRLEVL